MKTAQEIRDLIATAERAGYSRQGLARTLCVPVFRLASWEVGDPPTRDEEEKIDNFFRFLPSDLRYNQRFVSEIEQRLADQLRSNVMSVTVQGLHGPTTVMMEKDPIQINPRSSATAAPKAGTRDPRELEGVQPAPAARERVTVRFDDALVRLAVRAYVLAIPTLGKENELVPLISANKAYFLEDGQVIQYMQAVGNALTTGALGPDNFDIGDLFLWLSRVLPAVAMGDYGPYKTTSCLARSKLNAATQMFFQSDPALRPMVEGALQSQQGATESAIYNIVRQLDI